MKKAIELWAKRLRRQLLQAARTDDKGRILQVARGRSEDAGFVSFSQTMGEVAHWISSFLGLFKTVCLAVLSAHDPHLVHSHSCSTTRRSSS